MATAQNQPIHRMQNLVVSVILRLKFLDKKKIARENKTTILLERQHVKTRTYLDANSDQLVNVHFVCICFSRIERLLYSGHGTHSISVKFVSRVVYVIAYDVEWAHQTNAKLIWTRNQTTTNICLARPNSENIYRNGKEFDFVYCFLSLLCLFMSFFPPPPLHSPFPPAFLSFLACVPFYLINGRIYPCNRHLFM